MSRLVQFLAHVAGYHPGDVVDLDGDDVDPRAEAAAERYAVSVDGSAPDTADDGAEAATGGEGAADGDTKAAPRKRTRGRASGAASKDAS